MRIGTMMLLAAMAVGQAEARIVRVEITSKQTPTFEGKRFGNVGAYEKLRGKAYGEVDPKAPENAVITDIQLAPRNARGMVEYSMDVYLLKPVDLKRGSHKLFVESPNRGGKLYAGLNESKGGNDPTTADDGGDGFLMKMGYTVAWCGWDISALAGHDNMTITVPVARNRNGSAITGPSYEYISYDKPGTTSYRLTYPAASLSKAKAVLTVKEHLLDKAVVIPASGWEYVDENTIRLLPAGTALKQSAIYEFRYTAKNPLVAGLGLAATRDFVSFLRYGTSGNPLAGDVQYAMSFAISQSARYVNDFETLGFNADEQGRRVFDGILNTLGGGSGVNINYRFGQPDRTERTRQAHFFPEAHFPFAYPTTKDPLTGKTAGRAERCAATKTCAKAIEVNSANEYWVKAASLVHTDAKGNDLPDPANVRFFLISSEQHGAGRMHEAGMCQQWQNPTHPEPVYRALFVALDEWVTKGTLPPVSRVPRKADNTAALAVDTPGSPVGVVPANVLGWPSIPGVTYTGVTTERVLFDFGPEIGKGVMTKNPPVVVGRPAYPHFVSKVDADGNEVAGIRLPPVAAPTSTLTGWALRGSGFGEGDGCESSGQEIPFKASLIQRTAAHDPRPSLAERYGSHGAYVDAVTKSAEGLKAQRLLLDEDVKRYIQAAKASDVLK